MTAVGTAMGTIFAPIYATLVMAYLEEKLYDIIEINYGRLARTDFENNWDRFLDDCFTILDGRIKPDELLEILNNLNEHIQFTMELSNEKLPFLDIYINKDGEKLWMDIYYKPTDSKRYVPFNSCHPNHCLKNIPFCLARRICMIVENIEQRDKKLDEMGSILMKQKYPKTLVDYGVEKAKKITQLNLRKSKEINDEKIIAFISTFNPNNPVIDDQIKKSLEKIKNAKPEESTFRKSKFVISRRQPPSLERLLCKSEYTNPKNTGVYKCGKDCICCEHIKECKEILFKNQDQTFKIKSRFNCIAQT